jgi:tRNA dimethylallyltransferase
MSTKNPSSLPRLALIAGPTASGKSAHAIDLAERESGTIVNADASQVYRDLRILTARPSEADEARVPHLLYGYRDGAGACSAADWAVDAKVAIADVIAAGRLPILVGGTGLYLRTLIHGIAPVPEIDPEVRRIVRTLTAAQAHAALAQEDAAAAARLHPNDTSRIQRALEVVRSTGHSMLFWRERRVNGIGKDFLIESRIIDPPVQDLYARCDLRVDLMLAHGAVEEVAKLLSRDLPQDLPVMKSIGVAPLSQYLSGSLALAEAAEALKQSTRNYAKRQRTWFRNQPL